MIDWDRLNELRSEIGDGDFAEVVELFLLEADEVIARISVSAGATALEADLHFLKGAALNLGFRRFAALCQEGEKRAATGSCDIEIATVIDCYQRSKSILLKGVAPEEGG